MENYTGVFVGIDAAKSRNAIAIADNERGGEVRYLGEVDASPDSMRRVIQRIVDKHGGAHFCYEAGPTGYGLYRLIRSMGHPCEVVAPSLIPRKPGDRIKTNRRDAVGLAKLLRAGELTPVWVPDEGHEAMRDLVRKRTAAVEAQRVNRQQVSGFMLKHGRIYPRKVAWSMRYLRWLQEQRFDHPAHQIALQELVDAVRVCGFRRLCLAMPGLDAPAVLALDDGMLGNQLSFLEDPHLMRVMLDFDHAAASGIGYGLTMVDPGR